MNYKKKISYFLFKNEEIILRLLRILTLISSLLVLGVMVYRFGFNHTEENIKLIILTTRFFYLVFILGFLIRLTLAKDKQSFLSSNALEGILILLVIYDGVSYFLFGHPILEKLLIRLGIVNYRAIYHFFIQFFYCFSQV